MQDLGESTHALSAIWSRLDQGCVGLFFRVRRDGHRHGRFGAIGSPAPEPPKPANDDKEDILVNGKREDIAPLATFDEKAISAIGATSIAELLRGHPRFDAIGRWLPIRSICSNSQRVPDFQKTQRASARGAGEDRGAA